MWIFGSLGKSLEMGTKIAPVQRIPIAAITWNADLFTIIPT